MNNAGVAHAKKMKQTRFISVEKKYYQPLNTA